MENLTIALTHRGQPPSSNPATAKWKEILESRSYVSSVTKEHIDTVTQETLNTYDLVLNTPECGNSANQLKLRGLTVPVLNANAATADILKIAGWYGHVTADLIITDNTHEITEEYSENEAITGYSPPYYVHVFVDGTAPGFQVLGRAYDIYNFEYRDSLLAMEVGGKFLDDFVGTSRFVCFSFYYPSDTYNLTEAALTLLDRVITWLMGSAPPPPTYELTIQSSGVESVGISVSPDDENGEGDGITPFSREYTPDTEVTLIAPEKVGDMYFQKWTYDGEDSFDRTKMLTIPSEDSSITVTYAPLDYVDVIKFNVLKRDRAFSVAKRKKSFSVPKRAKNFKVEIK